MAIFSAILTFNFTADDYTEAWEQAKRIGDLVVSEDLATEIAVVDVELMDPADEELDIEDDE